MTNLTVPVAVYVGHTVIKDFFDFPAALAFCDYHKLTITAYYRNGVKVEKEEM
jgi:hypothetical protein